MKKFFLVLAYCWIFVNQSLKAQYYYHNNRFFENDLVFEIGASAGLMNALTDLGGKKGIGKPFIKDLNLKNSKLSTSAFFMCTYQDKVAARFEITYGNIAAYDSILKPVAATTGGRYERNLSFRSKITDFQLSLEAHPLFIWGQFDKEPPRFSPYAIAGIGFFSFDPEAQLNSNWYRLQPLHTEGQGFREYRTRKVYKLNQVDFPLGIGVKYELSDLFNLRFEIVHRILKTDYLDDVSKEYIDPSLFANYLPTQQALLASLLADRQGDRIPGHITTSGEQRGDPRDNDSFFSIQLKFSYTFGRQRR